MVHIQLQTQVDANRAQVISTNGFHNGSIVRIGSLSEFGNSFNDALLKAMVSDYANAPNLDFNLNFKYSMIFVLTDDNNKVYKEMYGGLTKKIGSKHLDLKSLDKKVIHSFDLQSLIDNINSTSDLNPILFDQYAKEANTRVWVIVPHHELLGKFEILWRLGNFKSNNVVVIMPIRNFKHYELIGVSITPKVPGIPTIETVFDYNKSTFLRWLEN